MRERGSTSREGLDYRDKYGEPEATGNEGIAVDWTLRGSRNQEVQRAGARRRTEVEGDWQPAVGEGFV